MDFHKIQELRSKKGPLNLRPQAKIRQHRFYVFYSFQTIFGIDLENFFQPKFCSKIAENLLFIRFFFMPIGHVKNMNLAVIFAKAPF